MFWVEWRTDFGKLGYKNRKKGQCSHSDQRGQYSEQGSNSGHEGKWMVLVLVEMKPVGIGDTGENSLPVQCCQK